jgi:hypothetical protein
MPSPQAGDADVEFFQTHGWLVVADAIDPVHVIATYETGVFVLRPVGIPFIEITRRLDADAHMVWHRPDLGDLVVTLEPIGGPCDTPPGTHWAR